MRYAIISGYLASLYFTKNENYKKLINKTIRGRLRTSVVNRYLTDKYYEYVQKYIFNELKNNPVNWMDFLYKKFNPSLYSKILFPYAKLKVSKRVKKFHNK
jgi:NADH:ubiquinone oxidoreductase subunit 5 (subunit L)/multisubunit Na+/H+ antiporter MnhA subunit